MILNHRILGKGKPIFLLHGLFGDLNNLNKLANSLQDFYQIIQVDLRNHGNSFWNENMHYFDLANDLFLLANTLNLEKFSVIGHSMGGKTAMKLTEIIPNQIEKIIVLDISPVKYSISEHNHERIFLAANKIEQNSCDFEQAQKILIHDNFDQNTMAFLLKSFDKHQKKWKFNLNAIAKNAENIASWDPIPTWKNAVLFIKGNNSNYIKNEHKNAILSQFPKSKMHIVANSSHNVHFEQPEIVFRAISRFLQND